MTPPDSDVMDQLTLLITTKNRSTMLGRVLRYYREVGLSCGVLISDASDEEIESRQTQRWISECSRHLRLVHYRQATDLIQSLDALLSRVETPFVLIAGDDDFFVPSTLARCAHFLAEHPDYNSACGDVLSIYTHTTPDGRLGLGYNFADAVRSVTDASPAKRVLRFYSPQYVNTTYFVQRTEHLRYSVRRSARLQLYLPQNAFSEFTLTSYTLIQGKVKHVPGLYHVRLRHRREATSKRSVEALDYGLRFMHEQITQPGWAEKLQLCIETISGDLMRQEAIDHTTATYVAETVFLSWFAPRIARNRDRLLARWRPLAASTPWRTLVKRLPGATTLWETLQALRTGRLSVAAALKQFSPYHQDFLPIYHALTSPAAGEKPAAAPQEAAALARS